MTETMTDGVLVGQDGRNVYANSAAARLLHAAGPEELVGLDMFAVIDPAQHELARQQMQRALAGESLPPFEDLFVGLDGSPVPVEISVSASTWQDRPALLVIVRDTTERKREEEALRKSEARLRSILDATPFPVALVDVDDARIEYWSRSALSLFGHTASTAEEWYQIAYPDPDYRREVIDRWKRALKEARHSGLAVNTGEYRVTCRDGSVRTCELHASFMDDRLVVTFNDISERKWVEEAARENEEQLNTILQGIVEGVYEVDIGGTMTFCNNALEAMLGYPKDELIGLNNRAYMDEANATRVYETFNRVYRTGEPTKAFDWELFRKDGARVLVEASVTLRRDAEGRPVGFRGLVRDVSERRSLEEQLRQAQKMEAVGSLAGGVAHDFNNLLQAMMSQVQVMRSQVDEGAAVAHELDELGEGIRRGAQLTNQLLLFSRRETGRLEVVDLSEVVRRSTGMLRRLVRANIEFVVEASGDALLVEADRGQLEQVLANLVVNAADAMPDGGRLGMRVDRAGTDAARLVVADNGSGIPAQIRDRIFDPFFTTKGVGRGTGLGLAVVHGIVTRHGGRIEVESGESGTWFSITLPLTMKAGSNQGEVALGSDEPIPPGEGERVLVVEDEPGAREGLRDMLEMLGYAVVVVGSGEEAASLPVGEPFDLLLTDLMLPGMPGSELAHRLTERWPGCNVILMSGYTEDEAVRHGVRQGSIRYLQKPFDMVTLAREVRTALDG